MHSRNGIDDGGSIEELGLLYQQKAPRLRGVAYFEGRVCFADLKGYF